MTEFDDQEFIHSTPEQAKAIIDTIYALPDPDGIGDNEVLVSEVPKFFSSQFIPVYLVGNLNDRRPHRAFNLCYSEAELDDNAVKMSAGDIPPGDLVYIFTGDKDQKGNITYSVCYEIIDEDEVNDNVQIRQVAEICIEECHADSALPVTLNRSLSYSLWSGNDGAFFVHQEDEGLHVAIHTNRQTEEHVLAMDVSHIYGILISGAISRLEFEANNDGTDSSQPIEEDLFETEPRAGDFLSSTYHDEEAWRTGIIEDKMLHARLMGVGIVSFQEAQAILELLKSIELT